jgi:hypothetical protein
MIAGKVWGETELLEANGVLEFHRIEARAGGVESGKLVVRVWKNNYDLVDETVLTAGQYTKVAPGEYHQFEALEDTVAFELYWAEFDHEDIERDSVGFTK